MMVKVFNICTITVKSYKKIRNKKSFLNSICFFKLVLFNAVSEGSTILRIRLFSGAANKIFEANLWLKFSFKCFAGSESLEIFSCSSHRSSTLRLFSPMYICSQTHTPKYMTHAGCGFLLLSLKSCFTFSVIHCLIASLSLTIVLIFV